MSAGFGITDFGPAPIRLGFAGSGFLAGEDPGIVTVAGAPAVRRVFVFDRSTHQLAATVVSDENGEWRVENLSLARRYYVVAFDHGNQFNAVIRDNITPAPMA